MASLWHTIVLVGLLGGVVPSLLAAEEPCTNGSFDGTYDAIQQLIFERHGCTNELCHGTARQGGLDLRAGASYDALIEVEARTVSGQKRVVPGRRDASLLFTNVAAKTFPNQYRAPLRPMPPDPLPALSQSELELLRRWIEAGAPRTGTVPGTAELVGACFLHPSRSPSSRWTRLRPAPECSSACQPG